METQEDADLSSQPDPEPPTIKHIVCSGGGVAGFAFYGAIKESNKIGLWKMENIQTIYATSVGTIVAVMLALNYDWETLDDYLIKRPWQHVFTFNLYSILDTINKRGMFGLEIILDIFLPLFNGKDVRMDITLLEFYKLTNIELHMFTVGVNAFKLTDISYKTHPDWTVLEAVYSSCAVPILFSPVFKQNECYCDGGLLTNYPIEQAIKNGCNPNEILGVCYKDKSNEATITSESTLLEYAQAIIQKLMGMVDVPPVNKIAHEYYIQCPSISISDIMNTTSNSELRVNLIQLGIDAVHK